MSTELKRFFNMRSHFFQQSSLLATPVWGSDKDLYGEEYAPVTDGDGASSGSGRAEDGSPGSKSYVASLFRTMIPR